MNLGRLGSHDQQGRIRATKTNKIGFVRPGPASENSKEIGFQQARNIGSDEMIETDGIGSIGADFMFVFCERVTEKEGNQWQLGDFEGFGGISAQKF
ncbi:hypothetical protein SLEP1_g58017 [Rubroshorea leprosula]|uniref:Uncharacterized protein n=1 Tax=Rubroshorea leprosula TaxID=152421 RepID=A0AAV5MNC5_9ROSI|nr:hypothetical protein SLEP1_g58017 [Rubroshorea leprosula]